MIFRGALIRLAAWYLLLLALILLCFNVIVYFSLSQALSARVSSDLHSKARAVLEGLTITGDNFTAPPQIVSGPGYADACVFVVRTVGDAPEVTLNGCKLDGLQKLPDDTSIRLGREGKSTEANVVVAGETFAMRTVPVWTKDGKKVIGVVQVAKAISWIDDTLKRLEQRLAIASAIAMLLGALVAILMAHKSLQPIRLAFQKQRDFVADASHELRTPLTLMRTSAEAWLRRAKGGVGAVHAQYVLDEVDHLTSIVGDLATLALADARHLPVDRRPVELGGMIREIVEHTRPLAEARQIELRPQLNGAVRVQADASRLRQLVLILLDNALQYTPPGGQVSIGVGRHNGRAEVTVSDTGAGIAADDLPHVFERFYRADKSRSRENGGTGLGLAIAKWIVDIHRGEIVVRSTPGQGTRVAVSLPSSD